MAGRARSRKNRRFPKWSAEDESRMLEWKNLWLQQNREQFVDASDYEKYRASSEAWRYMRAAEERGKRLYAAAVKRLRAAEEKKKRQQERMGVQL